jgi:hypothetical protein
VPVEPVEKRSCPRYPFSPAVEALDLQSDLRIKGRLADISRNGCYVDTINPFVKDAPVTLTISRDNQSFKTQAKVVYSKMGMGMGLLFTTAEPDQLRVLGSWLNELNGGSVDGEEQSNLFLQPETTKITDVEGTGATKPELSTIACRHEEYLETNIRTKESKPQTEKT